MIRCVLALVAAIVTAASLSAANPPWNPGGRTGTPTGVVAIPRPAPVGPLGFIPNDCADTLPESGDAIADFVNGPQFMCVISVQ